MPFLFIRRMYWISRALPGKNYEYRSVMMVIDSHGNGSDLGTV
jgi:hypothetical protein